MTTLAEHMIVPGVENRPPMLDMTMYNSRQSRMLLYIKGKKYERIMLESIENRPFVYPTIEENERECKLYNKLDKFTSVKGETLYEYYWRFAQLINDIPNIGMIMQQVQTNDLDSYDSNYDDISSAKVVLMINLSNYDLDVLSEYLQQTKNAIVQDTNSSAQQDSMIISMFEQMSKQMSNQVTHRDKVKEETKNVIESLTVELERYKERVTTSEQRLNVYLSCHEKYGYIKNHKKTAKNRQAQTRERKSKQKPEVKVNLGQASVKEKVNQGASLNQKRAIQELVNKMAGIDQSNQRISLAHSQAQATCDEEKAQRDMGFALNALSKQTQLSLKRIATLAIRVSSLVIQRWTRRNQ
ncbi:hypothetical protein Tco_0054047 [Tanacetum coccineum]